MKQLKERGTDVKLWNSIFTWQKDTLHSSDCEGKAFTAVGAKGKVVIIYWLIVSSATWVKQKDDEKC